jgi:hypothetical protein
MSSIAFQLDYIFNLINNKIGHLIKFINKKLGHGPLFKIDIFLNHDVQGNQLGYF